MGNRTSVPVLSFLYFFMAIVWTAGAFFAYGEKLFWLFLLMIPANVFIGIRVMRRQ